MVERARKQQEWRGEEWRGQERRKERRGWGWGGESVCTPMGTILRIVFALRETHVTCITEGYRNSLS